MIIKPAICWLFLSRIAKVKFVLNTVIQSGGIQYATDKMFAFRDEALTILYEFPDSDVRQALEELVRYTTDRKY